MLKITETEPYYNKCREQGLSTLSSNTVAMMANNILKNYKAGPQDLQRQFVS